ncbi:ornithine--oxo-acid transaminase [Bradyrhizobium prioriisuperbiae]|uniref:ornithine--oxo-acid transaminase n=1 Tax=Bradyrhizobium prioriisuperbiae TaxID=2854389 RepID=UPI0028E5F819|nr:ornithine--oxo-acid transaminase [Bradyrhizobium prioritasuperba]
MSDLANLEARFGAGNYAPLPVTVVRGEGIYLWDDRGRRYMDMMGAYSAVSFGHCHPRLVAALTAQAQRLDTISRAYFSDRLGPFLAKACALTGMDAALPMNSGAEAVETALKAARKWAYKVKGVPADRAEIIVADGNFHGRTIAITGFSTVPQYRDGFGPFPPGFRSVPFGNIAALAAAITPHTAAFLIEPIQGEGGINVPPEGYLAEAARICRTNDVLLLCDEIQTGLGRTGKLLACQHDGVEPDGLMLGKALGGGLLPVSLFLARHEVMRVFAPGDHGSTFGGNPIAAAVGLAALDTLIDEHLVERAASTGAYLLRRLSALDNPVIREVRGRGLFAGIELHRSMASSGEVVGRLLQAGVLTKDTHRNTIRLAPPLTIDESQIDWAIDRLAEVLGDVVSPVMETATAGEAIAPNA